MRLRPIALFVLIGLSAAACTSGSGQSSDTPSPSPSSIVTSIHSTPTTSAPVKTSSIQVVPTTGPNVRPGEKPPKLPTLARKHVTPGAVTFASYWLQTLDWGYATTDSSLTRSVTLSACSECARFADIFDRAKHMGAHFKGGRLTFKSALLANSGKHSGEAVVDVTFSQQRVQEVSGSGRVIDSGKAQPQVVYRVYTTWTGQSWKVADLDQVITK